METKKYDVTIGIPMYNAEDFIQRTMESVLSQTYENIEFLIVDDGSTDCSVEILHEIIETHPRGGDVRLIKLPHNQGPSSVRNLIIDKARGDYLYFMDSDDLIRKDTIALMMHYVCQEKADIVFGSLEKIAVSGERNLYQYAEKHFHKENELANYAYRKYAGIQASACNILARLSILRKNHLRFVNSNYWEDFAFVLDLVAYYTHAVLLPDITYTYLCRQNSLSNFQVRDHIDLSEIQRNIDVAKYMKDNSTLLSAKPYYPQRCFVTAMTDFYIACYILRHRHIIVPQVSDRDIRNMFSHPASFVDICKFSQFRLKNLFLYFIGKMPPFLCVFVIRVLGKAKKLI